MLKENVDKKFEEYNDECPNVKTIINWYDLYEGHYVTLDKDFQKKLFNIAIKKAGNYSEVGRKLNIGRKTVSSCSKGLSCATIRNIKKIVEYVNYPLEKINSKILEISNLKPKLPFDLGTEEGAEIRAAFLSDGHNDKSPTAGPQYCALEKELHERLIHLCKKVFGEFNSEIKHGNKTLVTRFPSVIGKALELSGVPRGNKMMKNCHLPKDILLGNKEIRNSYLRRVFDDEGDVCFSIKNRKRVVRITRGVNIENLDFNISPEKWIRYNLPSKFKHNLLLGEQLLLLKLGVDAKLYSEGVYKSKNGNITAKWRICIGQQDQLRRFAELINFSLVKKREKLNKILSSYQYRKLPNGEGRKQALEFIKKVFKEKGFFNFGDLGKEMVRTDRSHDLAGRYLKEFIEKNIIKKIKYGTYVFTNDKT